MLKKHFSGRNLIELTEQCRVLDVEFEEEVLRPLRETDFGPTEKGRQILRQRIIDGGPEVMEKLTADLPEVVGKLSAICVPLTYSAVATV